MGLYLHCVFQNFLIIVFPVVIIIIVVIIANIIVIIINIIFIQHNKPQINLLTLFIDGNLYLTTDDFEMMLNEKEAVLYCTAVAVLVAKQQLMCPVFHETLQKTQINKKDNNKNNNIKYF